MSTKAIAETEIVETEWGKSSFSGGNSDNCVEVRSRNGAGPVP